MPTSDEPRQAPVVKGQFQTLAMGVVQLVLHPFREGSSAKIRQGVPGQGVFPAGRKESSLTSVLQARVLVT